MSFNVTKTRSSTMKLLDGYLLIPERGLGDVITHVIFEHEPRIRGLEFRVRLTETEAGPDTGAHVSVVSVSEHNALYDYIITPTI